MTQSVSDFLDVLFGFRKFLIMLVVFGIAIVFRLKGFIDGGNMTDLLKAVTISFFGANGVEHFSNMAKTYFESKGLTEDQKAAK